MKNFGFIKMNYLFIVGCIFFTVLGQILIKKGAIELQNSNSLLIYLLNYYIIFGLLSALLAAASWIKALQHFDLSYAYPFMSLSFILVAFFSVIFFHETIKYNQWIGLLIILIGLYIGSR